MTIVHDRVEIVNLSKAIASKGQGVGERADTIFASIESVLAVVVLTGVAVGHDHVGQRRPVENRTHPALVLIPDGVNHQALSRGKSHAQVPLLPSDAVTVD